MANEIRAMAAWFGVVDPWKLNFSGAPPADTLRDPTNNAVPPLGNITPAGDGAAAEGDTRHESSPIASAATWAEPGLHFTGTSSVPYQASTVGDANGESPSDVRFLNGSTGDTGFHPISNGVAGGWHDIVGSATPYGVAAFGFDNGGFTSSVSAAQPLQLEAVAETVPFAALGPQPQLIEPGAPNENVAVSREKSEPSTASARSDAAIATHAPARLATTTATTANFWVSEGPAPGIHGQESVLPNDQINGAIQAIAVHPTNPNIMYVGSVNGGIWKTTNATAATPHWVPLTDNLPSLSIGALEFDPTDATHQTLIAGIGSTSSYFLNDQFTGVLRTTDGGATWSQLGTAAADLGGENVTSVAARGTILLAAADNVWGGGFGDGLFRSTDSGANWTLISDGAHGLPNLTSVNDIVGDPLNSNVLYAAVTGAAGGVFKSTDTGLTWTSITTGIGNIGDFTDKIELAVHHDATSLAVFATVDNNGVLSGVFRSLNSASFVALDVPSGGTQGFVHASIAAEPTNQNIVYVGFGGGSPNYLTRIDASKPSGSQITNISGGSFGSPHVDPREMQIDVNGNLILGTDGGLFRLPTPTVNSGVWSAIAGDMSVFELHSIAYDHISNIIMAGAQDNGTLFQQTPGDTTWDHPGFGDGGDVGIDDVSLAAAGQSIRYFSSQYLGGWTRQVYDSANQLVSTTSLASINDGQFTTPVELNNVDPTRLLVGGSGHIYVSPNQGDSLTAIANVGVNGVGFGGGGMMVYGGYQGAVANPDLIYAGSGSEVLKRTVSGDPVTSTSPGGGGSIRGVTDSPTDWATVFAIDNNQVFKSTNAGGTWVDVTANLTSISAADFRSIEYVPGTLDDALVVGTSSGVFYARASRLGGAAPWNKFGANLPDVIVYDLEYDASDNVLVAGTMGRGAWLVNDATIHLGIDSQPPGSVSNDLNGDGKSDIVWQHDNSDVVLWQMDGTGIIAGSGEIANPGPTWHFRGLGDLNGDGKSDIVWQHDNSDVVLWLMDGTGIIAGSGEIANPGPAWHFLGLGDLNGDGKSDIVWQHDNSDVVLWLMDGTGIIAGSGAIANPGPTWHFRGLGDLNGDGKSDIVWQHDNSDVVLWLMNGTGIIAGSGEIANPGPTWHFLGLGDLNGDGKSDIVWQHDNSDVVLWLMNGTGIIAGSGEIANPGPTWHFRGLGDLNGDRKSDILWQNDNSDVVLWQMDGTGIIAGSGEIANPGPTWHFLPPATGGSSPGEPATIIVPDGSASLTALSTPEVFDFGSWSFGSDTIAGFDPTQDAILLSRSLVDNFARVQADMSAVGGATLIYLDSSHLLTLDGVAPAGLGAANFRFL